MIFPLPLCSIVHTPDKLERFGGNTRVFGDIFVSDHASYSDIFK